MAELQAQRVRSVHAYLGTFTAKDFEGAATRVISQPRGEGKTMTGANYFLEHVTPNFYFHLSHTYASSATTASALGEGRLPRHADDDLAVGGVAALPRARSPC